VLQLKEKVCSKKTMQLEEYFEVFAPDDIRIKGHRIGIEDVINYHLKGYTSQQILQELPSLNLEKIYATLAYYYHNKTLIDAYLHGLSDLRIISLRRGFSGIRLVIRAKIMC